MQFSAGPGRMGRLLADDLLEAGNDVRWWMLPKIAVDNINTNGLLIDEKAGGTTTIQVKASTDPARVGPVDLVIVFVKCYHTENAVRGAAPMIGDNTMCLPQNGWATARSPALSARNACWSA